MMRRRFRALTPLLTLCMLAFTVMTPVAQGFSFRVKPSKASVQANQSAGLRIFGAAADSEAVKELMAIAQEMKAASNQHDLVALLKHYSPDFISGDSLTLAEVRSLIEDTWKTYPDIRYESTPLEIRVNGDWATIESLDTATATVSNKEGVINEPGDLVSQSRGMVFLRHIGKIWEITSDRTLYENAIIRFGAAKTLNATLSAPDQAFAGETYTAKISLDLPSSLIAIASIANDPIVFPQRMPDDRFRSLAPQNSELERVFVANRNNRNEVITASIGLTQLGQDTEDRLTVQFRGVMMIIRRVNVLPRASKALDAANESQVEYSANGRVDLRKKPRPSAPEARDLGAAAGKATPLPSPQLPSPEAPSPATPPAEPPIEAPQ